MPHTLDAAAVRTWCARALDALGRDREEIDAINVYPVADGDTGTNLYLTAESAAQAVEAVFAARGPADGRPSPQDAVRAMAHGALIGARGNSGTILAQFLRGMADTLADGGSEAPGPGPGGAHAAAEQLTRALARAAASAREAVVHPVEGTILTVADAAARAARAAGAREPDAVVRAAYDGARAALDATPGQLAALGSAGVVDAGGLGLLALLGALVETVTGRPPAPRPARAAGGWPVTVTDGDIAACPAEPAPVQGPAFEVIYLLEADGAALGRLKERLDALGDCLVVAGGEGLWQVHVHTDDAGAAVEAGVEAGRPYRIRVSHLAPLAAESAAQRAGGGGAAGSGGGAGEPAQRAVVAVVPGEGLAGLCAGAGATTLLVRAGEQPPSGEIVEAIRRAHAREVVLLPNDPELRHPAAAAAAQARAEGVRVALIPTRAAVQGIAALAVHQPERRFDEDVVAMTSAAGATRYGELAVAERMAWTTAGICRAGDVLGLIEGDIAVIGTDLAATAADVLDRMLAAGGELVTLVLGDDVPDTLAEGLEAHVRGGHLAVDTVVHRGGGRTAPLLIGVE
ncbi:DAK2 domain-containing protein [Streptomyces sp. DW26H14]|uniref:DAK2 domain-containing protein n=1 Tax=Streptomyces sp. DW26H14 TaxID=3435395 RepID=UPI00403D7584